MDTLNYHRLSGLVAIEHEHAEALLDEALSETFPASDPVAICFEGPPRVDIANAGDEAKEDDQYIDL